MGCGASKPINVVEPTDVAVQQRTTPSPGSNSNNITNVQIHSGRSPVGSSPKSPGDAASTSSSTTRQQQQQQQQQIIQQPPLPEQTVTTTTTTVESHHGNNPRHHHNHNHHHHHNHHHAKMNGGSSASASTHSSPSTGGILVTTQEGPSVPADETPNSAIRSIILSTPADADASNGPPPPPSTTTTTTTTPTSFQDSVVVVVSPDIEPGINDPQWKELWTQYKDSLMDPADVHATLQDLMSTMTNKLSDTELLFLQRRVRNAVRLSQRPSENTATNKGGGGGRKGGRKNSMNSTASTSSTSSTSLFHDRQETKTVVKNYHLLTPYVLRKVLPAPPTPLAEIHHNKPLARSASHDSNRSLGSLGSTTDNNQHNNNNNNNGAGNGNNHSYTESRTIHLIETLYLLALYCNDSLWDRVADIAVRSARSNNIEMDVNNKQIQTRQGHPSSGRNGIGKLIHDGPSSSSSDIPTTILPEPTPPTLEGPPDPPCGVPLHSLTFLLGLALRKYTEYIRPRRILRDRRVCVCVCALDLVSSHTRHYIYIYIYIYIYYFLFFFYLHVFQEVHGSND
jgi:hypothetical protein